MRIQKEAIRKITKRKEEVFAEGERLLMRWLLLLLLLPVAGQTLYAQKEGLALQVLRDHLSDCHSNRIEECKKSFTEDSQPILVENGEFIGRTVDEYIRGWRLPGPIKDYDLVNEDEKKRLYFISFEGTRRRIPYVLVTEKGVWKVSLKETELFLKNAFKNITPELEKILKEEESHKAKRKPPPPTAKRSGDRNLVRPSSTSGLTESKPESKCSYGKKSPRLNSLNLRMAFETVARFRRTNDFRVFKESGTKKSIDAISELLAGEQDLKSYIESREPSVAAVFKSSNPKLRATCDDGQSIYFEAYDEDLERWFPLLVTKTKEGWIAADRELVDEIATDLLKDLE